MVAVAVAMVAVAVSTVCFVVVPCVITTATTCWRW